jgi:amino acid permease
VSFSNPKHWAIQEALSNPQESLLNSRFVDDALGFALTWNYWFNDAVSTASDLIALQLLLQYWTDNFPGWAISLIFLIMVISFNVLSVRVYGEVNFLIPMQHINKQCDSNG